MKRCLVALCMVLMFAAVSVAAGPIQYQVTGPVLEVRDDAIVIQKGSEKWEIGRDRATAVAGDLKVGSKVTVYYTMQAARVEVKETPKVPKKK